MKVRILAVAALLVLAAPGAAPAQLNGGIELVDRPNGLAALPFDGVNEATVDARSVSADGCFVVIESNNDILSAADIDRGGDIFRVNRCAAGRPVELASATADGAPADRDTFSPSISADGRFVAFTVAGGGNLVPPGVGVQHSVVLKDMQDGSVEVMSRSNGNEGAFVEAFRGVVTANGDGVAFVGRGPVTAANGVATGDVENVYLRRPGNPAATYLASARSDGTPVNEVQDFAPSANGNVMALGTRASMVPGDGDDDDDTYIARNVISINAAVPELVSDSGGGDSGRDVAIADDASRVAFINDRVWASSCAATCGTPIALDGASAPPPDVFSFEPGFVRGSNDDVFWSTDRAVLGADTDGQLDMYLRDIDGAFISLATTAPGRTGGGDMTVRDFDAFGDGSSIVQVPDVVVTNAASTALPGTDGVRVQAFALKDGTATLLSQPAGVDPRRGEVYDSSVEHLHAVSDGGRFVAFSSYSTGLGAELAETFWDPVIAVRDITGATTTRVNVSPEGALADGQSDLPSIDGAGARVAFESSARNLVADATDGTRHVYLRDLATGTTQLLDRTAGGTPSAQGADRAAISGDGTKVAFISDSPDLPGGDGESHAFVADVATGTVTQVDATADGTPGDGAADQVDIDHDGSHAAFVGTSKNLVPGTTLVRDRVFVKDLGSGAVTFASIPENGDPDAQQRAFDVSISGDASRVAWSESGTELGYGADGRQHVFVRDLGAQTTALASLGGSDEPGTVQRQGVLDGDGSHLLFADSPPDGPTRILLRDLAAGTTVDSLPGRPNGAFSGSVDRSGRCVALNSNSPGVLASGGYPGTDFDHVYLAALGADCAVPPAGPGGGPGPGPGGADTTAPALSAVRMTRRRFRVGRKPTAIAAAKRGSAFVFTLSEDARTSIAIARQRPGRRVKGRCVKPTRRNRARKRCRRFVVRGTLTRAQTKQGPNRVAFSGRLGKRKLQRGRYRATLAAVDAAGNRSAPRRVNFRVVRR